MNTNTTIRVKDTDYQFIKNYRDIDDYRKSLNDLTTAVYGFSFEHWYQLGYWRDKYCPYSLLHQGRVVANISANPIEFQADERVYHTLQIGTVMTDPAYRNQGLSRVLMNIVLEEYENKCDLIYLYANDSVLEFYPKFGFKEAPEYIYTKEFQQGERTYRFDKLDGRRMEAQQLIMEIIASSNPVSRYSMLNNPGLPMFYLSSFLAENIYYCEELELLAIVEYEEDKLRLIDIYCGKDFDLEKVIQSLISKPIMQVSLGFTPINTADFNCVPLKEEGTTFFVKGNNFVEKGKLPELSHA
jgi:GNAT superfamily N-acetyltransferase